MNCDFSKGKCLHLAVLCNPSISVLQQVMHMSFLSYLLCLTVLRPPIHQLPFTCPLSNSEEQECQEFSQTAGKADTHPWSWESLSHDMFFSGGTALKMGQVLQNTTVLKWRHLLPKWKQMKCLLMRQAFVPLYPRLGPYYPSIPHSQGCHLTWPQRFLWLHFLLTDVNLVWYNSMSIRLIQLQLNMLLKGLDGRRNIWKWQISNFIL